jgi:DNA-binding PadR family transcriptional regulator
MGSLRYAMLGLINREPTTGYAISKAFSGKLGSLWNAKHSQIYPELKKLVNEGLIQFETVIQGEVLEKKVYTITSKGIDAFMQWLLADEEFYSTPKDNLQVRLYFCENMTFDQFRKSLLKQRERRMPGLVYLTEKAKEWSKNIPMFNSAELGDYMLLQGSFLREKAYMEWIDHCLNHIDDIEHQKKE